MTAKELNEISDHANTTDCDVQSYIDLMRIEAEKGGYCIKLEGTTIAQDMTLERMGYKVTANSLSTYIECEWRKPDSSIFWLGIKYDNPEALIKKIKQVISVMSPQDGFDFIRKEANKFDDRTASELYDMFLNYNKSQQPKTKECKKEKKHWWNL